VIDGGGWWVGKREMGISRGEEEKVARYIKKRVCLLLVLVSILVLLVLMLVAPFLCRESKAERSLRTPIEIRTKGPFQDE